MSGLNQTEGRLYDGGKFLGLLYEEEGEWIYYPDKTAGPFDVVGLVQLTDYVDKLNSEIERKRRVAEDCSQRKHNWATPRKSQKTYLCADCGEMGFWAPSPDYGPGLGPARTQAELDADGAGGDW